MLKRTLFNRVVVIFVNFTTKLMSTVLESGKITSVGTRKVYANFHDVLRICNSVYIYRFEWPNLKYGKALHYLSGACTKTR